MDLPVGNITFFGSKEVWFHGFWLVSLVFKVVSWFFIVFGGFPWFFKVVSWFIWLLVGFHGFQGSFMVFWLFFMVIF